MKTHHSSLYKSMGLNNRVSTVQKKPQKTFKRHHKYCGYSICDSLLSCLYSMHISVTLKFSISKGFVRTTKRQSKINFCLRHSIPYVTLYLGDLKPILPINEFLMTKKAAYQPSQFTVICCLPQWSSASTLTAPTSAHPPQPSTHLSFVRFILMLFCSFLRISAIAY